MNINTLIEPGKYKVGNFLPEKSNANKIDNRDDLSDSDRIYILNKLTYYRDYVTYIADYKNFQQELSEGKQLEKEEKESMMSFMDSFNKLLLPNNYAFLVNFDQIIKLDNEIITNLEDLNKNEHKITQDPKTESKKFEPDLKSYIGYKDYVIYYNDIKDDPDSFKDDAYIMNIFRCQNKTILVDVDKDGNPISTSDIPDKSLPPAASVDTPGEPSATSQPEAALTESSVGAPAAEQKTPAQNIKDIVSIPSKDEYHREARNASDPIFSFESNPIDVSELMSNIKVNNPDDIEYQVAKMGNLKLTEQLLTSVQLASAAQKTQKDALKTRKAKKNYNIQLQALTGGMLKNNSKNKYLMIGGVISEDDIFTEFVEYFEQQTGSTELLNLKSDSNIKKIIDELNLKVEMETIYNTKKNDLLAQFNKIFLTGGNSTDDMKDQLLENPLIETELVIPLLTMFGRKIQTEVSGLDEDQMQCIYNAFADSYIFSSICELASDELKRFIKNKASFGVPEADDKIYKILQKKYLEDDKVKDIDSTGAGDKLLVRISKTKNRIDNIQKAIEKIDTIGKNDSCFPEVWGDDLLNKLRAIKDYIKQADLKSEDYKTDRTLFNLQENLVNKLMIYITECLTDNHYDDKLNEIANYIDNNFEKQIVKIFEDVSHIETLLKNLYLESNGINEKCTQARLKYSSQQESAVSKLDDINVDPHLKGQVDDLEKIVIELTTLTNKLDEFYKRLIPDFPQINDIRDKNLKEKIQIRNEIGRHIDIRKKALKEELLEKLIGGNQMESKVYMCILKIQNILKRSISNTQLQDRVYDLKTQIESSIRTITKHAPDELYHDPNIDSSTENKYFKQFEKLIKQRDTSIAAIIDKVFGELDNQREIVLAFIKVDEKTDEVTRKEQQVANEEERQQKMKDVKAQLAAAEKVLMEKQQKLELQIKLRQEADAAEKKKEVLYKKITEKLNSEYQPIITEIENKRKAIEKADDEIIKKIKELKAQKEKIHQYLEEMLQKTLKKINKEYKQINKETGANYVFDLGNLKLPDGLNDIGQITDYLDIITVKNFKEGEAFIQLFSSLGIKTNIGWKSSVKDIIIEISKLINNIIELNECVDYCSVVIKTPDLKNNLQQHHIINLHTVIQKIRNKLVEQNNEEYKYHKKLNEIINAIGNISQEAFDPAKFDSYIDFIKLSFDLKFDGLEDRSLKLLYYNPQIHGETNLMRFFELLHNIDNINSDVLDPNIKNIYSAICERVIENFDKKSFEFKADENTLTDDKTILCYLLKTGLKDKIHKDLWIENNTNFDKNLGAAFKLFKTQLENIKLDNLPEDFFKLLQPLAKNPRKTLLDFITVDEYTPYFNKLLMETNELLFKMPGIVVKIIDWPGDVGKINTYEESDRVNEFETRQTYVKKKDKCVIIGKGCSRIQDSDKYAIFGDFRAVFDPSLNEDKIIQLPQNEEIFDYLNGSEYNIVNKIMNKKSVKLFGYGFSGSGKTFTLIQGLPEEDAKKKGVEEDKSLLVHTIEMLKKTQITHPDGSTWYLVPNITVDLFYPHCDNDTSSTSQFHCSNSLDTRNTIMEAIKPIVDDINQEILGEINGKRLLTLLEKINIILAQYAYILPTTNNPESSRAFTIINIIVGKMVNDEDGVRKFMSGLPDLNGNFVPGDQDYPVKSVQFIDLPGLEKKVDMIKDYFFPDEVDANGAVVEENPNAPDRIAQYVKKKGEELTPHSKNENIKTIYFGHLASQRSETVIAVKAVINITEWDNINNDSDSRLVFYLTENLSSTEIRTFIQHIIKRIIFRDYKTENFTYTENNIGGSRNVPFIMSGQYQTVLQPHIQNLIFYLNYTTEFRTEYKYEISTTKFSEIVVNFSKLFLNKTYDSNGNPNNNFIEKTEDETDYLPDISMNIKEISIHYKYIFDNIFNIKINEIKATSGKICFNINKDDAHCQVIIPQYKSPVLTCIKIIFEYIDINMKDFKNTGPEEDVVSFKILFLTMLLSFTLDQGAAIVTSLEHLLFEFLLQNPDGLGDDKNKKSHDYSIQRNIDKFAEGSNEQLELRKFIQPGDKTPSMYAKLIRITGNYSAKIKAYIDSFTGPPAPPDGYGDGYEFGGFTTDSNPQAYWLHQSGNILYADGTTNNDQTNNDQMMIGGGGNQIGAALPSYSRGYDYKVYSEYSGMIESVHREYLKGMHEILSIDDNSRFINIINILRRKAKDGDSSGAEKRCTGARNSLTFGEVLTNKFNCNRNRDYGLIEMPFKNTENIYTDEDEVPMGVQINDHDIAPTLAKPFIYTSSHKMSEKINKLELKLNEIQGNDELSEKITKLKSGQEKKKNK